MKTSVVLMLLLATVFVLSDGAPVNRPDEGENAAESQPAETSSLPAVKPLKKSPKSKLVKIPQEIGKKKPVSPKDKKKIKIADSVAWNVPPIEVEDKVFPLRGHSILGDGLFGDPESHRFLYPFDRF